MPIGTIIGVVVAYVAIAVLLLSLNLASRWRWWVKAGAIVITAFFYVGSYFAVTSLLGWSTSARAPERFSLVATRVVEPDKFTGAPGRIYLWIETLDDDNVPSGEPRSYVVAYSDEVADAADQAQEMLDAGEDVQGSVSEMQQSSEVPPEAGDRAGDQSSSAAIVTDIELQLIFNDMPPVRLPSKGVL